MEDERRTRRRRADAKPEPHSFVGLAVQRSRDAQAAQDAGMAASEVEALALEALGFLFKELEGCLPTADPATTRRDRSGWLRGLRRLASVGVLDGDLAGLSLAMAELDRGIQDPRLVAKGKSLAVSAQGASATTDKMRHRALAVQAFALFKERSGLSSDSKAFDHIEVEAEERGVRFAKRTLAKWRKDLIEAPSELRGSFALRFRTNDDGGPIDALELLLEAYSHALTS